MFKQKIHEVFQGIFLKHAKRGYAVLISLEKGIRDPMEGMLFVVSLGWGLADGPACLGQHTVPFPRHISGSGARQEFCKKQLCSGETPQFHNFPGWLLISSPRCSFQHASVPFQPLPGGEAARFGRGIVEHPLLLEADCSFGLGEGIITQLPCPSAHGGAECLQICLLNDSLKQPMRL